MIRLVYNVKSSRTSFTTGEGNIRSRAYQIYQIYQIMEQSYYGQRLAYISASGQLPQSLIPPFTLPALHIVQFLLILESQLKAIEYTVQHANSYEDSLESSSLYITLYSRLYYLYITNGDYGKVLLVATKFMLGFGVSRQGRACSRDLNSKTCAMAQPAQV